MKIYLSVPIVGGRNPKLAKIICDTIEKSGNEVISKWVISDDPSFYSDPKYVYDRDTEGVKKADLIVAEVSKPSHGVGMEIMLGITLGKKIIAIAESNAKISTMLLGAPNITWIFYDTIEEMVEKLSFLLRNLK